MSRVINLENAGKERTKLTRNILYAIREFAQHSQDQSYNQDLVAYIIIALSEISQTVDKSVEAWEKRGYWIKADRFRMEWGWAQIKSDLMYKHLISNDWDGIIKLALEITQKLSKIKLPIKKNEDKPWINAYKTLMNTTGDK